MSEKKRIWIVLYLENGEEIDLDVPAAITAEELLEGLNKGLGWGIESQIIRQWYLRSENPVAFLKGSDSLEECCLRDGSALFFCFPKDKDRKAERKR